MYSISESLNIYYFFISDRMKSKVRLFKIIWVIFFLCNFYYMFIVFNYININKIVKVIFLCCIMKLVLCS